MNRLARRAVVVALVGLLAGCATSAQRSEQHNAAQINTQLGINYAREGQYELALEKLDRALAQDRDYAPAWSALAVVQQARGENRAAEKAYRHALAMDGSGPMLKNNFGVFLCQQGERDEAQRLFAEAARDRRNQTPEEAWTNAGTCWLKTDPAKAETAFREALRLRSDFPDALAQMAILSYGRGDYLRTRAFLQRYDLAARATPELLAIAARSEAALGDRKTALRWAQQLQQDFPASAEAATFANWQP